MTNGPTKENGVYSKCPDFCLFYNFKNSKLMNMQPDFMHFSGFDAAIARKLKENVKQLTGLHQQSTAANSVTSVPFLRKCN
jgi:hypothetical protein